MHDLTNTSRNIHFRWLRPYLYILSFHRIYRHICGNLFCPLQCPLAGKCSHIRSFHFYTRRS